MPRPATGEIIERRGANGRVYRSLRFRAYGKRRTQPLGVVSREVAEQALEHTMADVQRGIWTPPAAVEAPPEPKAIPTFHAVSETFWSLNEGQWSQNTRADYRWRLEKHLIPYFGETPINEITGGVVRQYGADKLAEATRVREAAAKSKPIVEEIVDKRGRTVRRRVRPLSSRSINMTITLLGAILESAIDDDELGEIMQRNHARGRRVKEKKPPRSYLDTAGQIAALLDAAGELDRTAPRNRRHVERRAMLAVLAFGGLRIAELCGLRWRDVDLAGGWLHTGSKTDAGWRQVKIRGALRDELLALRQRHQHAKQNAYVFPTATGGQQSPDNFRSRVLGQPATVKDGKPKDGTGSVGRANKNLEAAGLPPLPPKLTPHSLRRTFCSLLYALGEDPGVVMDEMGHTDPALALRVYRQAMRRGEHEKAQLRALVEGADWANMGKRGAGEASELIERAAA